MTEVAIPTAPARYGNRRVPKKTQIDTKDKAAGYDPTASPLGY